MHIELKPVEPSHESNQLFLAEKGKKMLLNNEWVEAISGDYFETKDPATGTVLTTIAKASTEDVDAAVMSSQKAFKQGVWRSMLPAEKAKILWKIGELIEQNIDELSELETLDQGKPLGVARWAEIPGAAEQFRYFAGLCSKLESSVIPSSIGYQPPGKRMHSYTLSEPVGVVAAITPWNSPLVLMAMKLAPAFCAGCSVVLKPAEDTSLTAIRLGEICIQAGLPAGVLNIVTGYGHEVGQALAEHNDVDKVTFTGSTQTGRKILDAAKGNLKRVTLELGGKSPMIVMDDADLELAIPGIANAIFFNGGQVCVAGTRLYAHKSIADRLLEGVAEIAKGMKLGHGLDAETQMGPLVNQQQAAKVKDYIDSGVADGAEILAGGTRGGPNNTFIEPTVLVNCNNTMSVVREEIFGPVMAVLDFEDEADVVVRANDTEFGLAAGVFTQDLTRAHRVAQSFEAGTCFINSYNDAPVEAPFGGTKASGVGRENSKGAIEHYSAVKSVYVRMGDLEAPF